MQVKQKFKYKVCAVGADNKTYTYKIQIKRNSKGVSTVKLSENGHSKTLEEIPLHMKQLVDNLVFVCSSQLISVIARETNQV